MSNFMTATLRTYPDVMDGVDGFVSVKSDFAGEEEVTTAAYHRISEVPAEIPASVGRANRTGLVLALRTTSIINPNSPSCSPPFVRFRFLIDRWHKMLRRAVLAARPLSRQATSRAPFQIRHASASLTGAPEVTLSPAPGLPQTEDDDPGMNGGYVNPPRIKRSRRDPYEDWWDPQERRNYGEPVHEDNDILGVFSTEEYTHFSTRWGGVLMGTFVATFLGLCGAVAIYYPDRASVPRRFEGGLDRELGGAGALPALSADEEQ